MDSALALGSSLWNRLVRAWLAVRKGQLTALLVSEIGMLVNLLSMVKHSGFRHFRGFRYLSWCGLAHNAQMRWWTFNDVPSSTYSFGLFRWLQPAIDNFYFVLHYPSGIWKFHKTWTTMGPAGFNWPLSDLRAAAWDFNSFSTHFKSSCVQRLGCKVCGLDCEQIIACIHLFCDFKTQKLYAQKLRNHHPVLWNEHGTSKAPDTNLGDKLQARNWAAFVEPRGRERGWGHQQKKRLKISDSVEMRQRLSLKKETSQHFSTWVPKTYAVGLFSHVWPRFQMSVWEHLLPGNTVQISIVDLWREFWPQTSQLLGFHFWESWMMLASWVSRLDFWGFEFWRETFWYRFWVPCHWIRLRIETGLGNWHHLLCKTASL